MTPTRTISEAAIADVKARNPVEKIAGKWVRLRRHGRGFIGPCPMCSLNRNGADATRFECDADSWVCAVCADGGDVIKLVMLAEDKDFLSALEWLGGARDVDPELAAKRERERTARREKAEREAVHYREQERRKLFLMWTKASAIPESAAEAYLHRRGLLVPRQARLRCIPDMPYFGDGTPDAPVIWRGPAMAAAIVGPADRFAGLHFTYLDPATPSGKAAVVDPGTGEAKSAKKVRGSKAGGRIELVPRDVPRRLVIGEGIETVLSVWLALERTGRDLADTAFWSAIDLGHLGGKAAGTVAHPVLTTEHGRARRVPGPEPDFSAPGIAVPDSVDDIVLLGDGDSEKFLTECALARAAARFAREGRTVRVAWAPDGKDFNDLVRDAA